VTHERNAPCPCGSGRKYKHCCLPREQQRLASASPDNGVRTAMAWIGQRFRKQMKSEVDSGFFAGFDPADVREALARLGEGHVEMLNINIGDFLLGEAIYERGDDDGRGIDWVLDDGPRLTPSQRLWLEALADAPLRLYEVIAVRPGEGLELRDVLDDTRNPPFVTERTASMTLGPGDLFGARIVRLPDRAEISGAVYALDDTTAASVVERVESELDPDIDDLEPDQDESAPDLPLDPEVAAAIAAELAREDTPEEEAGDAAMAAQIEDDHLAPAIREAWLQNLLFPRIPEIVDRASGAPLMLIEDDYEVVDPAALAAALAACPDVRGDAREGWARLDDPDAEMARPLTSINPGDTPGQVTLFHRTQATAEAGREWFEKLAGAAVRRAARRVTDPREVLGRSDDASQADDPTPEFAPAELNEIFERVIRRTYANWCDEPIPALDSKTPRQCMSSRAGRERVRHLLRMYETGERRQAEAQGRVPVSYEFLWLELGLERDEPR
jgi:hypothetical protein